MHPVPFFVGFSFLEGTLIIIEFWYNTSFSKSC
jgi:hypothetical protein